MSYRALIQRMVTIYGERPSVATRYPRPSPSGIKVNTIEEARFAALVADALIDLSPDLHAEDDRAILPPLHRDDAEVLVKVHGSLRRAEQATGYSYMTIWRALQKEPV